MNKQLDTTGEDFSIWQVDNTVNGQQRYVVHYLAIPYPDEDTNESYFVRQPKEIEHAREMLKGKRYRAKWFGGGIVFQAYAGDPIMHVKAAIRSAETGLSFTDAYAAVRAEYMAAL